MQYKIDVTRVLSGTVWLQGFLRDLEWHDCKDNGQFASIYAWDGVRLHFFFLVPRWKFCISCTTLLMWNVTFRIGRRLLLSLREHSLNIMHDTYFTALSYMFFIFCMLNIQQRSAFLRCRLHLKGVCQLKVNEYMTFTWQRNTYNLFKRENLSRLA